MPCNFHNIKLDKEKVGFCRFKRFGDKYLITNEVASYAFLNPSQFKNFLEGNLDQETDLYQELQEKGFIKDDLDKERMVNLYRGYNESIMRGPSLHIIVVTLRCNFKCVYCQASRRPVEEKKYDMDKKTARKVVDMIFKSPNDVITIEFQGGEPLLNWPVVRFIVEYARKKNAAREEKKRLFISLVSNFSLMTEEKYEFLTENRVSMCTSLDGPEELHNKNRPWPEGNSYKATTSWIKKIREREKEQKEKGTSPFYISALTTISNFSLNYPKEIVDEYIKWGFRGIHLRPLSFLGLAGGSAREKIGYPPEKFLKFWREAMEYIIELNKRTDRFYERGSAIMLKKILTNNNPGFLDLRSPCGAAIGQLVYNYDGKVYTCDEGRMVKDDTFQLGDVHKDGYDEILSNPKVKTMVTASTLDNLSCDSCVYKPFCGVCPVLAYALYKNLFPQMPTTNQCKIHQGMLDFLFKKLQEKENKSIFSKWIRGSRL